MSLVVTTLDDVVDNRDGVTSLREAITFANSGDADGVDGIADTITFDPDLQGGTIVLENGELNIDESLNIIGLENTINANNESRAINFLGFGTFGDLRLESLTLSNGRVVGGSGGAIQFQSNGALTLENSRVTASDVYGDGEFGGGIAAFGDLVLNGSLIDNNRTHGLGGDGGGIYASQNAEISNSTITNNVILSSVLDPYGGGIRSNYLTLTNSTVVGNRIPGIFGEGGGISTRDANIQNSIILGNQVSSIDGIGPEINFVILAGHRRLVGRILLVKIQRNSTLDRCRM